MALTACTPLKGKTHGSDWGRIVTPLRLAAWEEGLASHPDREFVDFICTGIREGFRVGFDYHHHVCKKAGRNMGTVNDHEEVVEGYIQGERETGRLLGPFRRCMSAYLE